MTSPVVLDEGTTPAGPGGRVVLARRREPPFGRSRPVHGLTASGPSVESVARRL